MKPLKVAVCTLNQTVKAPTGLLYYYSQLARLLPEVDPETEYHVVVGRGYDGAFGAHPGLHLDQVGWDNSSKYRRVLSEHLLVGPWAARNGIDVVFFANAGVAPLLLPPSVTLVLGLFGFHQFSPGETAASSNLYRKALFAYSIRRSARIVLNSEYSLSLLNKLTPVDRERIDIFPHGRDDTLFHNGPLTPDEIASTARLNLPERYICFVSQMYRYKNVECAVEGFCRFVTRTGAPHAFVLVGQFDKHSPEGLAYRRQLEAIAQSHGLAERLVFLENIPGRLLRALYLKSDAYVQSSLAETFGKTTIEAMSCDCPVIAAHAAATPEVLGDAGLYYEPRDAEALARQLMRLIGDPQLAIELRRRGTERARLFSIRDEALQLAASFRKAARA